MGSNYSVFVMAFLQGKTLISKKGGREILTEYERENVCPPRSPEGVNMNNFS